MLTIACRSLLVLVLLATCIPFAENVEASSPVTIESALFADNDAYGVHCKKKVCSFAFKDTSVKVPSSLIGTGVSSLLEIVQDNLKVLPGGKKFALSKELKLQTPFGRFNLANADINLTLDSNNNIDTFTGKTQISFPSLGMLTANALVTADVGYTTGKYLNFVQAPLKPDNHYLLLSFDSNFRITAEIADEGEKINAVEFSIPKGRKLTVIIDPTGQFLYFDGVLTLTNIGQLLILNRLVESKLRLPFFFATDVSTMHISGMVDSQAGNSYMQIEGSYEFSENLVSSWLNSHSSVLAIEGKLRITREGLLLQGQSRSKILPDKLVKGFLQVETFVPFGGAITEAHTKAIADVEIPALNKGISGTYALDLPSFNFVADSNLYQQMSRPTNAVYMMVRDSTTGMGLFALRGYQSIQNATFNGYDWAVENATTSTAAATRMTKSGINSAKELAVESYDWSASFVVQTTATIIDGVWSGYEATTSATSKAYDTATDTAASVTNNITQTVQTGYESAQSGITQGYAGVSNAMSETVSAITSTVYSGVETVKDGTGNILSDTVGTVQGWCSWAGICAQSDAEVEE